MYKVEILPHERFEHAAIARRQREEQERKQRFFDPRTRVLGVDVKAFEEQIGEKHVLKGMEKQRERAFDEAANYQREVLEFFDRKREQERRQEAAKIEEFRATKQQPQSRREWYLNDPQLLKKELPPRVGDNDPRNTTSGLQKLNGEDLEAKSRAQKQKEQMRVWTLEQLFAKAEQKRAQTQDKAKYDEFLNAMTKSLEALELEQQQQRHRRAREDQEYNRRLAEEKRLRELESKRRETLANINDIQGQISGTFLRERPDAFNIGGGHKVRVDDFKGMTEEQKQEILRTQAAQREERAARKEAELKEQEKWAIQDASINRARLLLEREKERRQKEAAMMLRLENQSKSAEDKQRQRYLNKVVYTNPPQPDYFAQFNTSSR